MKAAAFFILGAVATVGAFWAAKSLDTRTPEQPPGLFTRDAVLTRLENPHPVEPAGPPDASAAMEELREAELDHQLLTEGLLAAKKSVEEAVVMVREQKENFEFAQDRYEKLMPLVETGALEPLAASQIQSAYISARAALAQAKFFLGQTSRAYQSEAARRQLLSASMERVESLRKAAMGPEPDAASPAPPPNQTGIDAQTPPPAGAVGKVDAFFSTALPSDARQINSGKPARVVLPGFAGWAHEGTVFESKILTSPGEIPVRIRVVIFLESLPPAFDRDVSACEVTLLP